MTVICIDTGGTHTDCYIRTGDGRVGTGKAPTTHYDLTAGFMDAIKDAASLLDLELDEAIHAAESIRYSTTVGTNVLIERNGPRLGLITTRGFEDTLHIGRAHNWADGLSREAAIDRARGRRPDPIIPSNLIVGIRERVDCFGNVVMPVDSEEIREKVHYLVNQGVRGVIVSLLWSFVNPIHEQQVREIILEEYPEIYLGHMPILLSHEVCPKICEYKRTVTTILDGYLRSKTEYHFLELSDKLKEKGYRQPLMVVRNTGGVASVSRTRPVQLYGAGPVAGIMGAATIGKLKGWPNILVTDMGGTSFDVGMIMEGSEKVYEFEPVLDRWRIALPIVASYSIGAGGGSIARVNSLGKLQVGPDSAGSMPGPACYNKGGTNPTVTDADLVLGYIDPGNFLGGKQRLNRRRAEVAIRQKIADPLGISVEEAAHRIRSLIDGFMGQEIFKQTAMKGYDPREFDLFAFGGAGPVHACGYAEYAEVKRIVTFPFGSQFNAFGALCMSLLQTYEVTNRFVLYNPVDESYTDQFDSFNETVEDLLNHARQDMMDEGIDVDNLIFRLELDMTYAQQIRPLRIQSPLLSIHSSRDVEQICDSFNQVYAQRYGKGAVFPEGGIQINSFVVTAMSPEKLSDLLPASSPARNVHTAHPKSERSIYWRELGGYRSTPIYDRNSLECGTVISGPAVIEAPDTGIVVAPGWRYQVDEHHFGIMTRE